MTSLSWILFAAVLAQAAPPTDFTGVWRLDPSRSETLLSGGQIDRGPIVITRSGQGFRIAPAVAETVTAFVENPADPAGISQDRIAGPGLVTDSQMTINGKAVTVRQTRTLAAGGAEMTVQTDVAIHHGYAGGEPLPQSHVRDVYVRAAAAAE